MSFCFSYNVVSENHSVQNSPWGGGGGGGSIASSRSIWFSCAAEVSQITLYRNIGVPYHFGSTVQERNYPLKNISSKNRLQFVVQGWKRKSQKSFPLSLS